MRIREAEYSMKNFYLSFKLKWLTLLLFFATPFSSFAQNTQNEMSYGIKIGGVAVTSANYQDITADNGFTAILGGTVIYDPESNTLSLNNAIIAVRERECALYYNEGDLSSSMKQKLNIKIEGASNLSATRADACIAIIGGADIKGYGRLKLVCANGAALYLNANRVLCIDNVGLIEAEGKWGISGNDQQQGTLKIVNSTVKAIGSKGSVCNFSNIALDSCEIFSPDGATVDEGSVMLGGELCTEQVLIAPVEHYGVWIGGVEITSVNYLNISPSGGFPTVINGQVSYSPRSHTLTLTDAAISADNTIGQKGIEMSGNANYNLVLVGKRTRVSAAGPALSASVLTITGKQGAFESQTDCGICILSNTDSSNSGDVRNTVTIDGCYVTASGMWGIAGRNGTTEALTVKDATVMAKGEKGSVCNLNTLRLDGCVITGPKSAVWNPEVGAICNPMSEIITAQVIIEPVTTVIRNAEIKHDSRKEIHTLDGIRIDTVIDQQPKGIYIEDGKKIVKP